MAQLSDEIQEKLWALYEKKKLRIVDLCHQATDLVGQSVYPDTLHRWARWYDLRRRTEASMDFASDLANLKGTEVAEDEITRRSLILLQTEAAQARDAQTVVSIASIQVRRAEHRQRTDGLEAQLKRRDEELKIKREALEITKADFRRQITEITKNLTSPDAPARLQALVALIDSL